jgi:dihydrofolate reductase
MRNKGFVLGCDDGNNLLNAINALGQNRARDNYFHTQKGIIEINGAALVMGEKVYTKTGSVMRNSIYRHNEAAVAKVGTTPKTTPQLVVKGDKDVLLNGLTELVLDRDLVLELVYIAGGSGLTNRILRDRRVQNVIISIVGKAHKGKDTALLLPAAMWTNAEYITTNVATEAALRKYISEGNTLPLIANDITVRCKILEETVSAFSDKRGLNTHFNPATCHYMPLLMSSNVSILGMGNKGESNGYASRIFEVAQAQYTDSAEHAEAIARWTNECYGVAGELFLEHIAGLGDIESAVSEIFEKQINEVREFHPDVNGRQQQMIAMVLATGELLGEALGVEFRLGDIRELLTRSVVKATVVNQPALDVMRDVQRLYDGDGAFSFNGTFRDYDPTVHTCIIDGDILYIRGKYITSHAFEGRNNEDLKALLVSEGKLIKGDQDGGFKTKGRGYTHRITRIKGNDNTYYAFRI